MAKKEQESMSAAVLDKLLAGRDARKVSDSGNHDTWWNVP